MNPITMGLGIMAVLYGLYTFYVRASKPEKFGKLAAMQEKFGKKAGYTIHLVAYSIAPKTRDKRAIRITTPLKASTQ